MQAIGVIYALFLPFAPVFAEIAPDEGGCILTAIACKNFPEFRRTTFRDSIGEQHLGTGNSDAACLKRAEDLHHWCGNVGQNGATVAATHVASKVSQVYHPRACENGWSQYDAFCYKHYWEKQTWFEAEALCRERKSHLASVHSRAENRFIYALTNGLSAWIGYSDLDQDTHYKWSDNTQDDFSNFAKNCTGREHEPDCKPEEKRQQWYDTDGTDAGTFVCKRNALLPVRLLQNVTAQDLAQKAWSVFLPELETATGAHTPYLQAPSSLEVKLDDALPLKSHPTLAAEQEKVPTAPKPRMGLPKGTFR